MPPVGNPLLPAIISPDSPVGRSQAFSDKFNALMQGMATNTPVSTQNFSDFAQNNSAAASLIARVKGLDKPKAIGGKGTGPKKAAAPNPNSPTYKADNFRALLQSKNGIGGDASPGLLDSIGQVASDIKPSNPIESFISKFVDVPQTLARPLDIITRPKYAIDEVLRRGAEDLSGGKSITDTLTDPHVYGGALAGLSGRSKTGFGQVVQAVEKPYLEGQNPAYASDLPDFLNGGKMMAKLEQNSPTVSKWAKRVIGGVGDVATDPITYVAPGIDTVAKESGNLGKEGLLNTIRNKIPKIIEGSPLENIQMATKTASGMTGPNISAADHVMNMVAPQAENLMSEIKGGAQAGKVIGVPQAMEQTAQHIATTAHNALESGLTKTATNYLSAADPTTALKPWSATKLAAEKAKNPLFEEWHNAASAISPKDPQWAEKSQKLIQDIIAPHVNEIGLRSAEMLKNVSMRVPTLDIMGHQVASFDHLGELFHNIANKEVFNGKTRSLTDLWHDGFGKAFSHTSQLPGTSFLLEAQNSARGAHDFEQYYRQMHPLSNGLKRGDLEGISSAINKGVDSGHPLQQAIMDDYARMHNEETGAGILNMKTAPPRPNYTFTHVVGPEDKVAAYKKLNAAMAEKGLPWDGIAEAEKMGLKPEKDALKNWTYRLAKSQRDLTFNSYVNDLATHYGMKSTMSAAEADKLNLTSLNNSEFLKGPIGRNLKPGETLYLDKDMAKTITAVNRMSSGTLPAEDGMNHFVKALDAVTKKFKTMNTVYFPGYHVKNFMSDMLFGALDGVMPQDYMDIIKGMHGGPGAQVTLGKEKMLYSELKSLYEKNASSGFISSEIGTGGGKISSAVRRGAEAREDFGRLAHFKSAMEDNFPNELAKINGPRTATNVQAATDRAVQSSVYRVNKYKFDFNALTPTERNFMRRGVPFYTYARKAIPTIMESMLLSPKYLSYLNSVQTNLGSGDAGELLPGWMKAIGYGQLVGGKHPWGIDDSLTPASTMRQLDPSGFAGQMNPILQGIFELKSNKDTFSGAKLNGVFDPNRVLNKVRLAQVIKKGAGDNSPVAEQALNLAGIPVRQVTEARTKSAVQAKMKELKNELKTITGKVSNQGYSVFLSERKNGTSIHITDASNKVVADLKTPTDAIAWLKSHTNYK